MKLGHLALLAACLSAAPRAGSAQIGGLIKKAKGATTKKTDSSTSSSSNVKSSAAFGPELTSSSLDAVLRGAGAAQAKLDQADQSRGQSQQAYAKADAASRGHDKDRQAYEASLQKNKKCWSTEVEKAAKAQALQVQQRMMSDPTYIADMQKRAADQSRQMMALNAKGDTAGMRKLAQDGMKANGLDMKADSDAARKTCGEPPAKPAFLADEDAARAKARQLDEHARLLQDSAGIASVAASGMSKQEFNLARERVVNWLHETKGGSAIQTFGGDERKLLESKKSQIMKLSKAFQ